MREMLEIAHRFVWLVEPKGALQDPITLIARAMANAGHKGMQLNRQYFSDQDFREPLDKGAPGIVDPPSLGVLECRAGVIPAITSARKNVWKPRARDFWFRNIQSGI